MFTSRSTWIDRIWKLDYLICWIVTRQSKQRFNQRYQSHRTNINSRYKIQEELVPCEVCKVWVLRRWHKVDTTLSTHCFVWIDVSCRFWLGSPVNVSRFGVHVFCRNATREERSPSTCTCTRTMTVQVQCNNKGNSRRVSPRCLGLTRNDPNQTFLRAEIFRLGLWYLVQLLEPVVLYFV